MAWHGLVSCFPICGFICMRYTHSMASLPRRFLRSVAVDRCMITEVVFPRWSCPLRHPPSLSALSTVRQETRHAFHPVFPCPSGVAPFRIDSMTTWRQAVFHPSVPIRSNAPRAGPADPAHRATYPASAGRGQGARWRQLTCRRWGRSARRCSLRSLQCHGIGYCRTPV